MKKHDILLLLVEQDNVIRERLHKAIVRYITRLVIAKNSNEAYQSYLKEKPDIILVDFEILLKTDNNFIQQIRKDEKRTRIIVMSAKPDTQLFIKAIEYGVKGFLQKPIAKTQLVQLLAELSKDIRLEKDIAKEEKSRLKAEKERDKSEKILAILSQATVLFFRYGITPSNIKRILKLIGKATKSSRVNLFKNFDEAGERFTGITNTWAKEDAFDVSHVDELKRIPFTNTSISKWEKVMMKGKGIVGLVDEFEEREREMLKANGVKSILSIPIYVDKEWWGFLSLDDCEIGRNWSSDEIKAMETVAYNMGAAIFRLKVEAEMININQSLENRVSERTAALEDEIAERMLTEELLKDREEKYRLIFENATDGIVLIQHNKVVLASPSMIEMMERPPKSLIGKSFGKYIVSQKAFEIREILLSVKARECKVMRIEVQIPNKDNKWLELKISRISWYNQTAFLIFATDISLQVKAENELKKLNKDLVLRVNQEVKQVKEQQLLLSQKSKLESLGELSAGLAHEINQPLLGISMGLDNILMASMEDGFSPSYVSGKISVLFKDIDRIKHIIEHVRAFSRGQGSTFKERIEINSIISNTLILANKVLSADYINFDVSVINHEIFVAGNPYRLEQVILNLLTNARHAVDESLKDKTRKTSQRNISIKVKPTDNFVFIAVTDDGIGIPKKYISKIFNPFFTTKNEEKGTGLGLSISFGIINEMKGSIEVDSIEKQYTTISIKLPICK
jgi:PAS domain S-box-containing protein